MPVVILGNCCKVAETRSKRIAIKGTLLGRALATLEYVQIVRRTTMVPEIE